MQRFENRIALVTGGGRGLGAAIVKRLASEGAQVMAVGPSDTVDKLAAELGPNVVPYRCDVTDEHQVEEMVAACEKRFGRLDYLVNNAGIAQRAGRFHEMDIDVWDRVMSVNVRGAFLVLRSAIALMIKGGQGGAVVNMGSLASQRPSSSAPYGVSKAAIWMMTRITALEYARDNIRINCVAPGTIATPMVGAGGDALAAHKLSLTPIGRIGTPEEVAAVTAFLLSDEAGFTTGSIYTMAGGREAQ